MKKIKIVFYCSYDSYPSNNDLVCVLLASRAEISVPLLLLGRGNLLLRDNEIV